LILLPFQLLKRFSDLKEKYQEKFRWISVDEYQDINFAQYHFLMQLIHKETNLCAIGDPNQAIYSFRGADVRYFNHFQQDFPGAKVISLGQNYRSTDLIIKAASQIISQNPNHHHFEIWSDIPGETRVEISQSATEKAEAEFVVHSIEKMLGGTGFFSMDSSRVSAADEENAPRSFSDFAVLYRMKSQLPALEEAFLRSGMPYQTMGETPLFEKPVIREILSYLKILQNPESDLDLLRIINSPPRGIGEKSIKTISDFCAKKGFSIFEAIERHERMAELNPAVHKALQNFYDQIYQLQSQLNQKSVSELIQMILDELGLRTIADTSDENAKILTLFLEQADSYGNRLSHFLVDHLTRSETDSYNPRAERVSLMTLHAAKGLEFPVVFIVGCEENILPYLKANYTTEEAEAAIQEERRLFYVGMTRARQQLFLCNARKRVLFGKTLQTRPSRFLKDIEETLKRLRTNAPIHKKKIQDDHQLGLFGDDF
ncbi:UvrD-helicase domain-containing protein, partial [candidate division KSB1 bacterium]|nr:UvrD-helicase domain-containing protein [candidate division KSB1 bacterium]